jgi:hypothetical protein
MAGRVWRLPGFVHQCTPNANLLNPAILLIRPQQITWLLNNNTSESKRGAGLAVLAIFGQCSSFLSSAVFPDAEA